MNRDGFRHGVTGTARMGASPRGEGERWAAPTPETQATAPNYEEIEEMLRSIYIEVNAIGADPEVVREAFVSAVKERVREVLADLGLEFEDVADHEDTEPIVQSKINEFWTDYYPVGIMKIQNERGGVERYLIAAIVYEYLRRDRDRIALELVRCVIVKRVS